VCIMCLRAIMNYQVSRWHGIGASGDGLSSWDLC
jgi:hypothetical protein